MWPKEDNQLSHLYKFSNIHLFIYLPEQHYKIINKKEDYSANIYENEILHQYKENLEDFFDKKLSSNLF